MDENRLKSWIVKILASKEDEEAIGTGFWAAEDGYILTCAHVIEGMDTPWVAYGEDKVPAKIIDQEGDIALLCVQRRSGEIAPLGVEWQRGDIIDSLGYQYKRSQGVNYFPMEGTVLGESEWDGMETITLKEAVHVKPGASGAPALNRRTRKVIGVVSHKWEKHQIAFVLSLNTVFNKWERLKPRFHQVDYGQEDIFDYYSTFVGKEKEFKVVQDFLQNDEGGYLLIQGKAGMGKTALVAELARRGAQRELSPHVSCLVFFIRQEGGRNTPEKFLDSLNLQLLQLLAEEEEISISLAEKKRQYEQLWKKVESQVSSQNRVLVLIDGLDESAQAGEQPLLEYLPPKLPPYVYWVLSSRPLPDVLSAMPATHFLRQAHSHWLAGLKPDEVRKLLRHFGDSVKRSDNFIKHLIKQTNGEPLFLRFLCQDIADCKQQAEAHLEEMPREVTAYFQKQFKLLRERTKGAYDRKLPLDILKILLVAYSGMTAEELAGVLGASLFDIREGLESIERFLLGKEHYELMHLEFRRTVEEMLVREEEKEAVREKLLAYCAEYWQKDRSKERYALRYYLQHLWELKRYREMFDLADNGYLEKKLGRFISPELLEEDYHALFGACKALGYLKGLLRWGVHRARISDEAAAFRDIENITEIIGKLVQKGMKNWWERGIGICALIPGTDGKIEQFLELCQGLEPSKAEVPEEIFIRIRELFLTIPFRSSKDKLIARYVVELCRWEIIHVDQALEVSVWIRNDEYLYKALFSVAQGYMQLQNEKKAARVLDEALEAAGQIEEEKSRSEALASVAQGYVQLQNEKKAATILDKALEAAGQIEEERSCYEALASVIHGYVQLQDVEKALRGLGQVLVVAAQIGKSLEIDAAARIGDEEYLLKNYICDFYARRWQEDKWKSIKWFRSKVFIAVVHGYVQLQDVEKALEIADRIKKERYHSKALISVALGYAKLQDVEKATRGLNQVFEAAARLGNEAYRSNTLASVAKCYAKLQGVENATRGLNQVFEAAAQLENEEYRSNTLASVAQGYAKLQDVEIATRGLNHVFEAAARLENKKCRSKNFASVAQGYVQLQDVKKAVMVLGEALDATAGIGDEEHRFEALVSVAQAYGELQDVKKAAKGLNQVLEAALIEDEEYRSKALAAAAQGNWSLLDEVRWLEKYRSKAIVSVAQGYGQLQDVDAAAKGLDQVLKPLGLEMRSIVSRPLLLWLWAMRSCRTWIRRQRDWFKCWMPPLGLERNGSISKPLLLWLRAMGS